MVNTAARSLARRWRRRMPTEATRRHALRRLHRLSLIGLIVTTAGWWCGAGTASANPVCSIAGPLANFVCDSAGKAASAAADSAVGGTFEKIVNSLLSGYQQMLTWALAWWIKLPSPKLDDSSSLMQDIHDHTVQIQLIGLTFSLMFFGLRMIVERKRSVGDDAEEGFKLLIRAALATSAIPLMLTVGGRISDSISNWLVSEAVGASADGGVIKNFLKLNLLSGSGLGTTAIGVVALVGFLGALLQLILLVVREAMLLLVVAGLPIAASFSGTGPGSQSYQRMVTWAVAFLLFKPVGALTYYIAFRAGSDQTNAQQVVLGMVLMLLCAFVLPSLMRLIAPAVSSMGSGGSGAAAAGAALGAAVAVGQVAAAGATGGASAAGGAGAGSAGGGAGMSSIASRGGGGPSGTSASASGSPPPPTPPSGGGGGSPGAQPALSGGDGGSSGGGKSGGGGPATSLSEGMEAGQSAGAAMSAMTGSAESEADATEGDRELTTPPPMRSGWNEHAMSH